MRMERLLSVLKGEAKRAVEGIGTNGIFYPTALKLLKREFGYPLKTHLKMKELFEQPPITFYRIPSCSEIHRNNFQSSAVSS